MSPIEIDEQHDAVGPCLEDSGRRASSKGFLAVSLASYLELLGWTGRQLQQDKVGKIPEHLAPILSRIGLDPPGWCDVMRKFGRVFKRAAGRAGCAPERIRSACLRTNATRFHCRYQSHGSGCGHCRAAIGLFPRTGARPTKRGSEGLPENLKDTHNSAAT